MKRPLRIVLFVLGLLIAAGSVFFLRLSHGNSTAPTAASSAITTSGSVAAPSVTPSPEPTAAVTPEPTAAVTPQAEPETAEEAAPPPEFRPHCTGQTDPSEYIEFTRFAIEGEEAATEGDEGTATEETTEDGTEDAGAAPEPVYEATRAIRFGSGSAYTDVEGIVTFRGNNFRNAPSYGFAEMPERNIRQLYQLATTSLTHGSATWSGHGWTGQPLMMKWPRSVKKHMNMFDWAKESEDLVEVIYPGMGGNVYFFDLATGEATREPLYLGYTFKGSGALDPRGYPLLYVGSGFESARGSSRAFIVSLLDGSILYEFGEHDPFALRNVNFFDSSALVDAETDTLIYPGENGVLYLIHLNTDYRYMSGKISVKPEVTRWTYKGLRSSDSAYWLGMEDSAAAYEGYLFVADNGGHLLCIDLDTLTPVWVQDTLDDTNDSPVLSEEDGHLYLYISTSFHYGWRSRSTAEIPVWKIDAETGEIVWKTSYDCGTVEDLSGGVQSTIAVGEQDLSDYLYVTVARTGGNANGVLACLDRQTGEVVWEHTSAYSWSSPVCIYDRNGQGSVLYCNSTGQLFLVDGRSGEELQKIQLSSGNIEASPAVFNNYVVVGTRACEIFGLELF